MSYWMLVILTLIIGLAASGYVNNRLKKYSKIPNSLNMTGAQAAQAMLNYYGVQGVQIKPGGDGQDFFSPKDNSITLSPDAYNATTITAIATACHEVGHACQYAQGYTAMKVRTAIVPVVNLASNLWIFILMIGVALVSNGLINLAIIMYAAVVLFHVVTLPVEFNASHRAIDYMKAINISGVDRKGSFDVLRACALTYVAAALSSFLQLLYLLGQRRD